MSESMRYVIPSIATLFLPVEGCFAQMTGTAQQIGTFTYYYYNPADCSSTGAQYIGFTYYNLSGGTAAVVQRIGPFRCNNLEKQHVSQFPERPFTYYNSSNGPVSPGKSIL